MSKVRKLLLTALVVGIAASVVAFGVFSAFSATTDNSGNEFTAGTVTLSDNDASGAMFDNVTGGKPGATVERCIKVTYGGSLPSEVRVYTTDASLGALAPFVDVTITPGTFDPTTPAFPSCTNFDDDAGGPIFTGTLSEFRTDHGNWNDGVPFNPGGGPSWSSGNAVAYRVAYTVQDDNDAQGLSTGAHSFTWEARNK